MGLIIGLNCWNALQPREIVYGEESDPYAIRSLLSWYITGPLYSAPQSSSVKCNKISLEQEDTITTCRGYVVPQRMVKEQITPEAVGQISELDFSKREKGTTTSGEDIRYYETMENGINLQEDLHYKMPLPFKHQHIQLPNNYAQAEKHLNSLKKWLMSDGRYFSDYCSFMSEIISKGYARKVDKESEGENRRVWYLPHHGIYHLQKLKQSAGGV